MNNPLPHYSSHDSEKQDWTIWAWSGFGQATHTQNHQNPKNMLIFPYSTHIYALNFKSTLKNIKNLKNKNAEHRQGPKRFSSQKPRFWRRGGGIGRRKKSGGIQGPGWKSYGLQWVDGKPLEIIWSGYGLVGWWKGFKTQWDTKSHADVSEQDSSEQKWEGGQLGFDQGTKLWEGGIGGEARNECCWIEKFCTEENALWQWWESGLIGSDTWRLVC